MFYTIEQQNVIKKTTMVEEYSDDWDPIWRRMNNKLNLTLLKPTNLKHLKGEIVFLWERNHRCQAWVQATKEHRAMDKEFHVQVPTIILDG